MLLTTTAFFTAKYQTVAKFINWFPVLGVNPTDKEFDNEHHHVEQEQTDEQTYNPTPHPVCNKQFNVHFLMSEQANRKWISETRVHKWLIFFEESPHSLKIILHTNQVPTTSCGSAKQ